MGKGENTYPFQSVRTAHAHSWKWQCEPALSHAATAAQPHRAETWTAQASGLSFQVTGNTGADKYVKRQNQGVITKTQAGKLQYRWAGCVND